MEFWGIEVKAGQTVRCQPGEEKYIHLSQASLGETKKGNVSVPLYVHFEGKKLVIGTLSSEKFPQISYDLVFEKEFELSHSWKDGSVFFTGYKTVAADEDSEGSSDTDSESGKGLQSVPFQWPANGKPTPKKEEREPAPGKAKVAPSKVKGMPERSAMHVGEDDNDEDSDEGEDSYEDEDESEDGASSDEDMDEAEDESDEEESPEEDEKVTPNKPEGGKKRPAGSDTKTPAEAKKIKVASPTGKADGKKGGHIATPYPKKQAAKTPATDSKPKSQTPKSGGSFSCKSCCKTFNSENAVQSHTKAKHGN